MSRQKEKSVRLCTGDCSGNTLPYFLLGVPGTRMRGVLCGVGVGPGDPELLTLKAVRALESADVIACPEKNGAPGTAYGVAVQACPQIAAKEALPLRFPMERGDRTQALSEAAERIRQRLSEGKNVVFLTLGDPGFYSTFSYVAELLRRDGYEVGVISGVPSFCAVSARLGLPVALGEEAVLITAGEFRSFDGTLIVLKAGSRLKELKAQAAASGKAAYLVENCGMPGERVYDGVRAIPDEAGYFSVLIVK